MSQPETTERTPPPRGWADMSFEFKAMFAYHVALMAMFVTGLVPIGYQLAAAGGWIGLAALTSIVRRRKLGWKRPPRTLRNWLGALASVLFSVLFCASASPMARPDDPHIMPWYLMGLGIALINLLSSLKLVYYYEADFLAAGAGIDPPVPPDRQDAAPGEPAIHGVIRFVYRAASGAVMLAFMAFFYLDSSAIRDGAPHPTASLTAPITEKGSTVYVTPERAALIGELELVGMLGIPIVIFAGFGLQLLGGVRLFPGGIWMFGKRVS